MNVNKISVKETSKEIQKKYLNFFTIVLINRKCVYNNIKKKDS